MEQRQNTNEINFRLFWKVFCRRLWVLLIALVAGAGIALGYTKLLVTPVYSSEAKFLLIYTSDQAATTLNSSYQLGIEQISASYALLLDGNVFQDKAAAAYNEQNGTAITAEDLHRMAKIEHVEETATFTVTVKSGDAALAYRVLAVFEEMVPAELDQKSEHIKVELIQMGKQATVPDSPNVTVNVLVGAMAAFVIVYVIFFLLELLDKTLYHEEELKEAFDLPLLSTIPEWNRPGDDSKQHARKRKNLKRDLQNGVTVERDVKGRLLQKNTPFAITEAFKTLRTNLMYVAAQKDETPVFGFVSDFAGAGKSLVASNVAIAFAQLGKKVLLIDGDMRCPIQHRTFEISRHNNGLSEALAGLVKDPFGDCAYPTAFEGLDLITCGRIPPNPNELLASEQMKKLIESAKERYDYVLIDLPPVCATSDAGVLASWLTGYVLVARAAYSNSAAVQESIDVLNAVNANLVGTVFNDVDLGKRVFYYQSHGRYYTRYYRNYAIAHNQSLEEAKEEQK